MGLSIGRALKWLGKSLIQPIVMGVFYYIGATLFNSPAIGCAFSLVAGVYAGRKLGYYTFESRRK